MSDDIFSDVQSIPIESDLGRKHLSGSIDALFLIGLINLACWVLPYFSKNMSVVTLNLGNYTIFVFLLLLLVYRVLCVLLFNVTIGMKVCGIVLLNKHYKQPSRREKVLAAMFILIDGVEYYRK